MKTNVSILAVFDGHNGAEASDMASKLLLDYFYLHLKFILDDTYSPLMKNSYNILTYNEEQNTNSQLVLNMHEINSWHDSQGKRSKDLDGSYYLEILKESLLRTIHDIDATFSKEASEKNLISGSTAAVVLIVDGEILAANVGDSKAILCTENSQPLDKKALRERRLRRRNGVMASISGCGNIESAHSDGPTYYAKELTRDHHPDRDDERTRVEAAGGFVSDWAGVPRVNDGLAVSRSIGDVRFKRYGVISTPEVTNWQSLTKNDSYMVVASDGVFDKMTKEDVCDLLWYRKFRATVKSIHTPAQSAADCIVATAFEHGSMDNIAAIVVPLGSPFIYETFAKDGCDLEGAFELPHF